MKFGFPGVSRSKITLSILNTNIGSVLLYDERSFCILVGFLNFASMKWLITDLKYGLLSSEKVAVTKNIESIFLELTHLSFNSIESWLCRYGTQTYPLNGETTFAMNCLNQKVFNFSDDVF